MSRVQEVSCFHKDGDCRGQDSTLGVQDLDHAVAIQGKEKVAGLDQVTKSPKWQSAKSLTSSDMDCVESRCLPTPWPPHLPHTS